MDGNADKEYAVAQPPTDYLIWDHPEAFDLPRAIRHFINEVAPIPLSITEIYYSWQHHRQQGFTQGQFINYIDQLCCDYINHTSLEKWRFERPLQLQCNRFDLQGLAAQARVINIGARQDAEYNLYG